MRNSKASFPANGIRVCVDRYENMDVEGRIYTKLQPQPVTFKNCGEMFLKTDCIFDQKGYPQSYQRKRSFVGEDVCGSYCARPKTELEDGDIADQQGECGTFDIIVQSRRKAGWQGYLKQLGNPIMYRFASELELLKEIVMAGGDDKMSLSY